MKKQFWIDSVVYLICMVVACLVNLAVSALILKLVDSFVALDYFSSAIVRIASGFLTGGIVIGAVVYREAYKSLEVRPVSLALSIGLAGIVHMLLCLLLMFHPFIAGGVRDLAGILSMGSGFDSADIRDDLPLGVPCGIFDLFGISDSCLSGVCVLWKKDATEGKRDAEGVL